MGEPRDRHVQGKDKYEACEDMCEACKGVYEVRVVLLGPIRKGVYNVGPCVLCSLKSASLSRGDGISRAGALQLCVYMCFMCLCVYLCVSCVFGCLCSCVFVCVRAFMCARLSGVCYTLWRPPPLRSVWVARTRQQHPYPPPPSTYAPSVLRDDEFELLGGTATVLCRELATFWVGFAG